MADIENIEFQEISKLPATEDKANAFIVVSHEESGVNTAKKFPLPKLANQQQVDDLSNRISIVESQGSGKILWFETYNELNTTFPNPNEGQQAWVGTPYPGTVWNASGGVWSDTHLIPDIGVDPADIMLPGGYDGTGSDLNNNKSEKGGSPLTMAQMDEKKADKNNLTGGTVVYSDQLPDDIVTEGQLVAYTRIDQMNAYAASKDDAADLQNQINDIELSQGTTIGVAQVNTVPVDTSDRLIKYAVKTSGTFSNFKDSANASLVVTSTELQTQEIEFWGVANVWQKVVVRTFPNVEQAFVDKLAEANLTQAVQNLASDKTLRANILSYFSTDKVTRVLLTGASIVADTARGVQGFIAAIGNHIGWSGNETLRCGVFGGNYVDAYQGWKKQPYGGFMFIRLRGESTSNSITQSRVCKRIVVRYSKETDGGECDLWVDGVYSQTINCNGAQRYSNEAVVIFDEIGYHTLEIKAPASGYAYLETIDFCKDNNGLHYMTAALGGSALTNHFNLRGAIKGLAGIPIEGNNGLDSIYNNTDTYFKPDVIICTYTVNDAGAAPSWIENIFKPALARMVECAQKNNTQIVYIIEMGGHYSFPTISATNYAKFQDVIKTIRSYSNHPNVTVVDWHKKSGMDTTDFETLKQLSLNYYDVTYDEVANTFTGDHIHPNGYGRSIVQGMLTSLFGIAPVKNGSRSFDEIVKSAVKPSGYSVSDQIPMYSDKYLAMSVKYLNAVNSSGIRHKYEFLGSCKRLVDGELEPVWHNKEEINYFTNANANIANSPLSDKYGKYVEGQINHGINGISSLINSNKAVTFTFVAGKGSMSLNLGTFATAVVINGKVVNMPSQYIQYTLYDDINIVTVHARNVATIASPYVTTIGRVYAAYLTFTEFACITDQLFMRTYSPVKLFTGKVPYDKLEEGKIYQEEINGLIVRKQCIDRNGISVPATANNIQGAGIFLALDRNHVKNLVLTGTVTQGAIGNANAVPDSEFKTTTANPNYVKLPGIMAEINGGKKYTLCGIMPFTGNSSLRIMLASGVNILNLLLDGSWNTSNTNGILLNGVNLSLSQRPLVIPFTMPTDQLGANTWELRLYHGGGSVVYSEWTLAEGSDAMV